MGLRAAFNLFCSDVDAQFDFYRALLGWEEDAASRSPIFRALRCGGLQFGLNARVAYGVLGLADREPLAGSRAPVTAFATFIVDEPAQVDQASTLVALLGGTVIQAPFPTYYGQWQAVLADPEQHVFRVAAPALPAGTTAAAPPF